MKLPVQMISKLYRSALFNPKYRWGVILASLIYLISPLDFSPDLIPILGQIDDIALLMLLLTSVSELITQWMETQQLNRAERDRATTENGDRASQTIDVDAVSVD